MTRVSPRKSAFHALTSNAILSSSPFTVSRRTKSTVRARTFVLLLADYLCRVVFPGASLRVGVVTTVLGAPFFLFLLARHRRGKELMGP